MDFLLCSLKRQVLQDIKKCDSLDHWLIVVDAAGTKRSVYSGIFDVLKKILSPQAKRCRLCVFAGSEFQGLAMTMTKISETFVQAKCLECKLDAEPLRTAGKTAQGVVVGVLHQWQFCGGG